MTIPSLDPSTYNDPYEGKIIESSLTPPKSSVKSFPHPTTLAVE